MLDRLFPSQADNSYDGLRAALWLLGLLLALKLVMSLRSIFDTVSVAVDADGIPLDSFGPAAAREVVLLFALMALGHLVIELIAVAILIRWRALVPFIYLVLLGEHLARRFIAQRYRVPGTQSTDVAWYVNYGLLTLLTLGLVLSLVSARARRRPDGRP